MRQARQGINRKKAGGEKKRKRQNTSRVEQAAGIRSCIVTCWGCDEREGCDKRRWCGQALAGGMASLWRRVAMGASGARRIQRLERRESGRGEDKIPDGPVRAEGCKR